MTSWALVPRQCLGVFPSASTCSKSPLLSRLPTYSGAITEITNGLVTGGSPWRSNVTSSRWGMRCRAAVRGTVTGSARVFRSPGCSVKLYSLAASIRPAGRGARSPPAAVVHVLKADRNGCRLSSQQVDPRPTARWLPPPGTGRRWQGTRLAFSTSRSAPSTKQGSGATWQSGPRRAAAGRVVSLP